MLNEDCSLPENYYSAFRSSAASVLKLPENLRRIEKNAFEGIATERIEIPAFCKNIDDGAFAGVLTLKEIRIAGSPEISECAFDYCAGLFLIIMEETSQELFDAARSEGMIIVTMEE